MSPVVEALGLMRVDRAPHFVAVPVEDVVWIGFGNPFVVGDQARFDLREGFAVRLRGGDDFVVEGAGRTISVRRDPLGSGSDPLC